LKTHTTYSLHWQNGRNRRVGDINGAWIAIDPRVADLVQASKLGGRTVNLVSALGARLGERSITLAGAVCALHRKRKSVEQIEWRAT
jgi:hypothetical protein